MAAARPPGPESATGAGTIWTRPVRSARGPRPEHTRDRIAAAAITLADAGGLPAASMRAVAATLGTGGGSLYRYLSSRDDLLDLMVDAVLGELPQGPAGPGADWLDEMVALAREVLVLHRRHPWLLAVDLPARTLGPQALDYFDRCLAILAPVPAGTATKMEAIAMITGVVSLFTRNEVAAGARSVSPGQLFGAVSPERHPHLLAALTTPVPAPRGGAELFDRTVRSLLQGLLGNT
jgi:AcrR family transcriptional regulator